jgi:hypothetical protein
MLKRILLGFAAIATLTGALPIAAAAQVQHAPRPAGAE